MAPAWDLSVVTSSRAKAAVSAEVTSLTPVGDGVGGKLLTLKAKSFLRWSPEVPFDLPIANGPSGGAADGRQKTRRKVGNVRGARLIRWSARVGSTIIASAAEQTLVGVSVHFSHFGQNRSV